MAVVDRIGGLRAARPRLDELTVGILVAAIHQFAQCLYAIGPFVVDPLEIESAERVMFRADDEEGSEASGELFLDVAKRRCLERRQLLGGAAAKVGAAGTQLVGFGRRRRRLGRE